ncbi:MAG: hypothetical protein ACJ0DE_05295 [Dehalococcoidia bacterium]|jgi:hypothetical protein|tara:strand:+ start:978 stop:1103 length:126 start_codon:yes stop_codon:yes gene_type:complete
MAVSKLGSSEIFSVEVIVSVGFESTSEEQLKIVNILTKVKI